ncbi:MAG TPA: hypothetical protein PL055_03510 [Methanobacterium sp.]|jgi:uncharacterized membrane protein|nr:MAG: hypothetical protein FGO69_05190 [Methanobacterium sp.]HOI71206.1 hypothetical protein [Methanobacterium sp.]HPX77810.1 hypothetical protein [Methanobacterium sp.]
MTSETILTSRIKYFQMEYPDGVPISILKLELDMSVEELQRSLLNLEEQGILFIENEEYVKLVESPDEDSKELEDPIFRDSFAQDSVSEPVEVSNQPNVKEAETYDLSENEIKALEIIRDLTDESGHIPLYTLEGTLLYGDLKLNTLGVYNLIMSLENKGIIRKVQINDSEYYAV